MKGVTRRQREILDYLQLFLSEHRYAPTYREIQQRFGFASLSSVHKHLTALQTKGYLTLKHGCSRSLLLVSQTPESSGGVEVEVAFMGYFKEGTPVETFSQVKTIQLPSYLVPHPNQTYILKVRGDTLREECIDENDLVIVEAKSEAEPGELIVALINGHETVLKRFRPEGAYVHLESTSPSVQTMIVRAQDLVIQGVVVGLLRFYK